MPFITRNEVRELCCGHTGYRPEVSDTISDLVNEYMEVNQDRGLICGGSESSQDTFKKQCASYVQFRYNQFGLTGLEWMLWPIISAFISWTVHRILDAWWANRNQPTGAMGASHG